MKKADGRSPSRRPPSQPSPPPRRLRPERQHRLEPPRGAADLGGSDRGQHGPLRVPQPGQAEHGHDRLELDPRRGSRRRAELLHVLADARSTRSTIDRTGDAQPDMICELPLRTHRPARTSSATRAEWTSEANEQAVRQRQDADQQHRPALNPERTASPPPKAIVTKDGVSIFAGQRDDPFFGDVGAIFDLVAFRKGTRERGRRQGLPLRLQRPHDRPADPDLAAEATDTHDRRLGVDRAAERHRERQAPGGWTQVSRLGKPLVNEVVIPTGRKDLWNRTTPEKDAQFKTVLREADPGG